MAKEKKNVYTGTGHRKTSVARVTLTPGTGKITVNGKDVHDYLPFEVLIMDLTQPLDATNTREMFDVNAEVKGGGFQGQTGAIRLGIARALLAITSDMRPTLKVAGMLTRNARAKERKKYGLKAARRAPQFSKR